MSLNGSAIAGAAGTRQVTSADRLLMYGIERWPSNPEGYWQSKMSDARIAAIQAGLDPDLVKTVAHVAFEVDDLEQALRGQEVIIPPNSPSAGVIVAFIKVAGAPVELLQIDRAIRSDL